MSHILRILLEMIPNDTRNDAAFKNGTIPLYMQKDDAIL